MINVSTNFLNAAKATVRRPIAKVEICWTDPYIDNTIQATANDVNYTSYPAQVADNITSMGAPKLSVPVKYAHLGGTWKLDGTFRLAPGTAKKALDYQMGWWGKTRCKSDCTWNTNPEITLTFGERPVHGILVVGDNGYNEYPVDFDVFVYLGEMLLVTREVRNNDGLIYNEDLMSEKITAADKMKLVIRKWSTPNQVVKIAEFFTGITVTYEGDDILSMNILEEMELSEGSLPVGNISSNEMDLKLQNIDDRYCAGNSDSMLYNLVKKNRRVKPYLGFKYEDGSKEYVPMGVFWTGDWTVPENEAYASTTCRDRMELLRKMTYSKSVLMENTTLYDIAESVLVSIKEQMPDFQYTIDSALRSIDVALAWFPRQDYMKTIKQIAQACLGHAYFDRDGVFKLVVTSFDPDNINEFRITKDDYFNKTQPAKTDEVANVVEVTIKPKVLVDEEVVIYTSEEITLESGETKSFTFKYSSEPSKDVSVGLQVENSSIEKTYSIYSTEADVTLKNNATTSQTVIVVISGKEYEDGPTEVVTSRDEKSIVELGEMKYEFKDNHLIQTREQAKKITDNLVNSYKNVRKDVELDWRGNPALVLSDAVEVPDYQRNGIDNRFIAYIVRQSIQFDGSLRCKTEARRLTESFIKNKIMQNDDAPTTIYQDTDGAETIYQESDE
jgi:hypothetical protein